MSTDSVPLTAVAGTVERETLAIRSHGLSNTRESEVPEPLSPRYHMYRVGVSKMTALSDHRVTARARRGRGRMVRSIDQGSPHAVRG